VTVIRILNDCAKDQFDEKEYQNKTIQKNNNSEATLAPNSICCAHTRTMLKFFNKLNAADSATQQQQQLTASAAIAASHASAAAALRRGPGRPRKLLNAHNVIAAGESDDEPAAKRCKYQNWSVHSCMCASAVTSAR
jgi:hypothetical protein